MDWMREEEKTLFQTYRRQPLVIDRAKGSWVWDARGKKYLDFFAGLAVNNLGHCNPAVVKAASAQLKKVIHASNLYYTQPQIRAGAALLARSFPGRVFFCNSGAEANECAVKLARRWGRDRKRFEIISFEDSFHGRTFATISLTGQAKYREGFDPLLEKVQYARFNDMQSVRSLVTDRTAAIFVEPIQGEGGINVATPEFLKGLRELCDRREILLVFDEVQCGLGRAGQLFAFQHYGVQPDVVCLAKGLGGGLPIGAAIAKERVAELFKRGDHASTFGGNPVACAAAEAVLKTLDAKFLSAVRQKGAQLQRELLRMQEKFPQLIQEVRGVGLMIGIELKMPGDSLVEFARNHGLLINCTHERVLRLLPPLTVNAAEIRQALKILERTFAHFG